MYPKNTKAVMNFYVKQFTENEIDEEAAVDFDALTSDQTLFTGALLKITFTSMSHDLRGIGKIQIKTIDNKPLTNYPVFVRGVLEGETAQVIITKVKKDYAEGKLVMLNPQTISELRTYPVCPFTDSCGGCTIQHVKYYSQLTLKRAIVAEAFRKFAGIKDIEVEFPIANSNPFKYRNKVQVPFGYVNGETVCGYYQENSHQIIPFKSCYLQSDKITAIIRYVLDLCNEYNLKGYVELTKSGDIRHLIIRESYYCSTIMVIFVVTNNQIASMDKLVEKLVKKFSYIDSVYINVNKNGTNVILGEQSTKVFGKNIICDRLLGNEFQISDRSFFQINTEQAENLYRQIIKYADFKKTDIVIDAYCGIGTIAISLAPNVKKVYGVEIVPEAINDAIKNARLNKIKNVEFFCAKAEEQIKIWQSENIKVSTIVVDPPRKGCDTSLLKSIVEMGINKIIYVSCDPATLARDCEYLLKYNYHIKVVQPVDLFSQTSHIETVVFLERKYV